MKRRWLVILGVVAFIAFALTTLPARVLLGFFSEAGVHAAGVEGTVWNGRAQVVRVGETSLGAVEWNLHALALLTLQLKADVKVTRPDGFGQARVSSRSPSAIKVSDLSASLPLHVVADHTFPGTQGTINMRFDTLILEDGWPRAAEGYADLLNVSGANRQSPVSGSFKLSFPAPNSPARDDVLVGALSDIEGPLQVSGTLELRGERGYLFRGLVNTRPGAPKNLENQLVILGSPDAQGRRQFSVEGVL